MTKPGSGNLSIIPAAAVFDRRLSNADVRVLAALGTYAGKDGRCWPAVTTLSMRTGICERHVRTCLHRLAGRGYLEIERRPGQSSLYRLPRNCTAGVGTNPGTGVQDPRHWSAGHPGTGVPPNDIKNDTKNDYAFAGKIIRLTKANFDTWANAYQHIDLGTQLQALDDYYDNHLTGDDRNKWFARCSQALAKKNERARAEQAQQREEPKFNDGVY